MLTQTQTLLIKKDIQTFANSMALCILLGFIASAIFLTPGKTSVILGSVLYITALLGYYPYLVATCVAKEHREKNTIFVMSLPITRRAYLNSKVIACSVIYFICWAVLLCTILTGALITGHLPALIPSYVLVVFGTFIPAFLLTLSIAIYSESEGWTIATFVFSNTLITLIINIWPNLPAAQEAFAQGSIQDIGVIMPPFIQHILLGELFIIAALSLLLAIIVLRKKQFITCN